MTTTAMLPAGPVMPAKPKRFKRFSVGAILGGVVGALVGGPPGALAGAALFGGVGALTGKASPPSLPGFGSDSRGMTPSRAALYREAMESMREPHELRTLATAYDQSGLKSFATMLRKRAEMRELPQPQKQARQDAFRRAMASDEPGKIAALAAEFASEGSIKASNALYDHAAAVRAALAAGAKARPVGDARVVEQLGERLRKAIIHFGSESMQAKVAAATLLKSGGVEPNDMRIRDAINAAKSDIASQAQTQLPDAPPTAVSQPEGLDDSPIIDMHGTQTSVETPAGPPPDRGEAP